MPLMTQATEASIATKTTLAQVNSSAQLNSTSQVTGFNAAVNALIALTLLSPYVVGASSAYTTIQSAINAAATVATSSAPQFIAITPGTYNQNTSWPPYVYPVAIGGPGSVTIVGNAVFNATGANQIFISSGIIFQTPASPSGAAFSVPASSSCTLYTPLCQFIGTTGYAFECLNAVATVNMTQCSITGATGYATFHITRGTINCDATDVVGSNTASIVSGGSLSFMGGKILDAFNISGGGVVTAFPDYVQAPNNQSFFTIGAGSFGQVYYTNVNSGAASGYWASGTGTLQYNNVTPTGTAQQVDPGLTVNTGTILVGGISLDGGNTLFNNAVLLKSGGTMTGNLILNADPTVNLGAATKQYVDSMVANVLYLVGGYDASGNVWPSSGGSGSGGAIEKGNLWYISVAGTLGGNSVMVGDAIVALVNTPGQTASNWDVLNTNLTYVPENVANKSTSGSLGTSDILYPTQHAVKTYVDTNTLAKANNLSDVSSISSSRQTLLLNPGIIQANVTSSPLTLANPFNNGTKIYIVGGSLTNAIKLPVMNASNSLPAGATFYVVNGTSTNTAINYQDGTGAFVALANTFYQVHLFDNSTANGAIEFFPFLLGTNDLSDIPNPSAARTNLGLGSAATKTASNNSNTNVASVSGTITSGHIATFADTSGTIQDGGATSQFLQASNNLSDLNNVTTALGNLNITGKHDWPLPMGSAFPALTNGATPTPVQSATNLNNYRGYSFAQSGNNYIHFRLPMPKSWNQSTLTFILYWKTTGTSGNVVWSIQGIVRRNGDAEDTAFGSAVTITSAANASAQAEIITAESSAMTPAGTAGNNCELELRINRNGGSGSDTLAAAAVLIGVDMRITTNAGNDA